MQTSTKATSKSSVRPRGSQQVDEHDQQHQEPGGVGDQATGLRPSSQRVRW